MSNFQPRSEFYNQVRKGNIPGHSLIEKFGRLENVGSSDISTAGGALPLMLFDTAFTGPYDPPTEDTLHDIVSDDATGGDTGVLVTDGVATGYDKETRVLSYTGTNHLTPQVGDTVVNDTTGDHTIVKSVTDANNLVVEAPHHFF